MGKYAQIKENTNLAVSWVIETAKAHGNHVNTSGDGTRASAKQGRLKGKDRKATKQAAKTTAAQGGLQSDHTPLEKVMTAEIRRQMTFLEGVRETIVLPWRIRRALESAIKGRREYARKFSEMDPGNPENAPHVYFVNLLQDLADRLSCCKTIEDVLPRGTDTPKQDTNGANLFDQLSTLDEDAEEDSSASSRFEKVAETSASSPRYEALVDPKEEALLYILCLHEDAEEITNYVISLWDEYFSTNGNGLDLGSVAWLTDVALTLVDEEEVNAREAVFTISPGADFTLQSNPMLKCWDLAEITLQAGFDGEDSNGGYILQVKQLEHRMTEDQLPVCPQEKREDTFLVQYMMDARLAVTILNDQRSQSEKHPEIAGYSHPVSWTAYDLITSTVVGLFHGGLDLRLVLPVAVNVLHTIRHLWPGRLEEAFGDMKNAASKMESTYVQCIKARYSMMDEFLPAIEAFYCLSAHVLEWPLRWERYVALLTTIPEDHPLCGYHRDVWRDVFKVDMEQQHHILKPLDYVPDHAGCPEKRQQYASEFVMPPRDPEFLRKNNPALCGKLLLSTQVAYHKSGLAIAKNSPQIGPMAHLYNLMRQLDYLDQPWPAMDAIIAHQIKPLFRGALPTDRPTMIKRWMLVNGASAATIAALSNPNAKFDAARLEKIAKTPVTPKTDLQTTPMLQIISDNLTETDTSRTLHRLDAEMVRQAGPSALPRSHTFRDCGHIFFLEELRKHMLQMQKELQPDYVDMTMICNNLFKKMHIEFSMNVWKKKCVLTGWNDPHRRGEEILGAVVDDIDMDESAKRVVPNARKVLFPTPLMDVTVKVLKAHIEGRK